MIVIHVISTDSEPNIWIAHLAEDPFNRAISVVSKEDAVGHLLHQLEGIRIITINLEQSLEQIKYFKKTREVNEVTP